MVQTAHIVVVDDDPDVREMVDEYPASRGFTVTSVADAAACRVHLSASPTDLVLLDINMPGEDGLTLARHIRETYDCGIIMLTGAATTVDRIIGLEIGADDYVSKPFDPRELLARVRSVLRRSAAARPEETRSQAVPPSRTIRIGRCLLDLDARTLTTLEGEPVSITAMEFDLLLAFAERPNRVLSRDQLLDLAHHRDWEPFDRSIDIRITRIRRKIEIDPSKPECIKTIRGAGYMFVPHHGDPDEGNAGEHGNN